MEEKKVMWIDSKWECLDDIIIKYALVELWRNAIDSKVLFINSYGKETFYNDLLVDFIRHSFFKLYNGMFSQELLETDTGDKGLEFLKEKGKRLKEELERKEDLAFIVENSESYDVQKVFSSVKNPEEYTYMLRLDLLANEWNILNHNCNEKVLSMDLYYYITEVLKAPCILYSGISYCDRAQTNWEKYYLSNYNVTNKDSIKMMHIDDFNFSQYCSSTVPDKKRRLIKRLDSTSNI